MAVPRRRLLAKAVRSDSTAAASTLAARLATATAYERKSGRNGRADLQEERPFVLSNRVCLSSLIGHQTCCSCQCSGG